MPRNFLHKNICRLVLLIILTWMSFIVIYADAKIESTKESDQLFDIISERLSLMKNVALYKYINKQPIYVQSVEEKILFKAGEEAKKNNLPKKETQDFIKLQMEIAARIQEDWCEFWKKDGAPNIKAEDIDVIRGNIRNLTEQMIIQIAKSKDEISEENKETLLSEINKKISIHFVSYEQKKATLESIFKIINVSKKGVT
jgi:chorismate mutase-like protein